MLSVCHLADISQQELEELQNQTHRKHVKMLPRKPEVHIYTRTLFYVTWICPLRHYYTVLKHKTGYYFAHDPRYYWFSGLHLLKISWYNTGFYCHLQLWPLITWYTPMKQWSGNAPVNFLTFNGVWRNHSLYSTIFICKRPFLRKSPGS